MGARWVGWLLLMSFAHLTSAECTDTGRKRSHNEDALLRFPEQGVFCVADGMGGIHGGEIASRAVVDGLQRDFDALSRSDSAATLSQRIELVRHSLNQSSTWIKSYGQERAAGGAGTTAIIFVADPVNARKASILHAGDSRAYCFRRGQLVALTKDHSVAAAAGVESESALPTMFRGVITRAVGLEKEVTAEETSVSIEPGDLFVLCSDGLTKLVKDPVISQLIEENVRQSLTAVAERLVRAANEAGGDDNVSVLLIRASDSLPENIEPEAAQPQPAAAGAPPAAVPARSLEPAAPEPVAEDRWTDMGDFAGESVRPPVTVPGAMLGRTPADSVPSGPPSGRAATEGDVLTPVSEFMPSKQTAQGLTPEGFPAEDVRPEAAVPGARVVTAAVGLAIVVVGTVFFCSKPPVSPPPTGAQPAAELSPGNAAAAEALAAFRVDVREALLTGHWGGMDAKAGELQRQFPAAGEGTAEWSILLAWLKEWKKAQANAGLAKQLLADLRASASAALATAGLGAPELQEPAWRGDADADANSYCASASSLFRQLAEAVGGHAAARAAEISHIEAGLMPTLAWMQKDIAVADASARESFAALKISVADLKQWSDHNAAARLPPSPALFGEAGALMAAVEKRADDFYDRLAGMIRSWGFANMPVMTAKEARSAELFAAFNRVYHGRDRYKTDVRAWRANGGQESVLGFFRLLAGRFPEKSGAGARVGTTAFQGSEK